jgi:hypothetical protein
MTLNYNQTFHTKFTIKMSETRGSPKAQELKKRRSVEATSTKNSLAEE